MYLFTIYNIYKYYIMKGLSLFVLILGIIFITIGYMENKMELKNTEKEIEYRIVPSNLYEEQIESKDLVSVYSNLFVNDDPKNIRF